MLLARLILRLETDREDFGYYQASNLQGVLMQQIEGGYAETLHGQGLKPYSQYILSGARKEWIINTLTEEAYRRVILPLTDPGFTEFDMEKKGIHIKITGRELKTVDGQELLDEFYRTGCDRNLRLEFLTPASFKSGGRYVNMPDVRYLYQSLMNKYGAASETMEMYDEETLEELVKNSAIVQYKLRSALFPVEGIRIPSFKGEMRIRVGGAETMARYARLLFRFGEYSGVGIKTAMGMGALKRNEEIQ